MHRLAALAALLVAISPALADGPKAPELALDSYRLQNGLKVVLHRDPAVPRVTVCVAYHVGSKNERARRTGFAHFFEHMMFRGTKNVPNYDIPLQEAGAQSNAFTTEDVTAYFETVPSNYLERALYLEAERLAFLPSALDQMKFDTEREVVKNERRQSVENVPYGLAEETLLASVFPKGHPYSWSVIGSMKDLDDATLDDLKAFFAEFYHPANATLTLVGDFDSAEAKRLVEKYFGPLVAGPAPRKVSAPEAKPVARKLEQPDEVQLPRVYWAWPSVPDTHPDAPALDMLDAILSTGEASRLHRALVRDKRLAKDVSASNATNEAAGLFTIRATADEGKGIAEIEKAIADELERLRAEPPAPEELSRQLATVESNTYQGLTTPLSRAITIAVGSVVFDDPTYNLKAVERLARVTPADVRRVAREYLTPEKVVLVIRPAKEGEKEPEPVQAGPDPSTSAASEAPKDRAPKGGPDWSEMPGPAEPRPFHAPKVVRKTLSNGLDLWVVSRRTLPIVSVDLVIPAGTADDPKGKSGLAKLSAALLDQGTETKTATELAEAIQALGAGVGVSIQPDETGVSVRALSRNLAPTLALVGEMLASPRFDPEDFDRERDIQLAGLLQGPDNPGWIAARAFRALLYGSGHPYGNPTEGYTETVKALTLDDIKAFHKARVAPAGSTVIVVGDVEPETLVETLESTLGAWKGKPGVEPGHRPPAEVKAEPGVAYLVDKPGAVQSVLSVGRRWVDRDDPRYFATLIGNRILGADFLSRLNQNLREEHGFTYGAGSAFRFRRSGSVWAVSTNVRADATADALKEVLKELDTLAKDKPFTTEEIGTARDAEARSYPEQFEAPGSIAGVLEEMALFHLPADYLDTYLDRLQAATPEQIRQAMTEVVDPHERIILVVGDAKSVEPKLKALGFKEIRRVTPDGRPAER